MDFAGDSVYPFEDKVRLHEAARGDHVRLHERLHNLQVFRPSLEIASLRRFLSLLWRTLRSNCVQPSDGGVQSAMTSGPRNWLLAYCLTKNRKPAAGSAIGIALMKGMQPRAEFRELKEEERCGQTTHGSLQDMSLPTRSC